MDINNNNNKKKTRKDVLEKLKKRKQTLTEKNTKLIIEKLNAGIKNIVVADENHMEKLELCADTINVYKNLGFNSNHWSVDYRQGMPSSQTYSRYIHANLCTYTTLDGYFKSPPLMPLIWARNTGWPIYMTFMDIMNEFCRYEEYLKTSGYISSNTIYAARMFHNMTDKNAGSDAVQELCKRIEMGFDKIRFTDQGHTNESSENTTENAKKLMEAIKYIMEKKKKPKNFVFHELVRNVDDMSPLPNLDVGSTTSFMEAYQKIFHDGQVLILEQIKEFNQTFYELFKDDDEMDTENTNDKIETQKALIDYHVDCRTAQSLLIKNFANYIINLLCFCNKKTVPVDQIELLNSKDVRLILSHCEHVEEGEKNPFDPLYLKRAHQMLSLGLFENQTYNIDTIDLINEVYNINEFITDPETTFLMVSYFLKPLNNRIELVGIGMRTFQSDVKHDFYSKSKNSKDRLKQIFLDKVRFSLVSSTFNLPLLKVKTKF